MKNYNLKPKQLGQNFLKNKSIAKKIVDLATKTTNNLIVEVGPGGGALSYYIDKLTNKNKVLVEIDKQFINDLKNKFLNCKIINLDVLKINFNELLNEFKTSKKITLFSNLPYNICGKILYHLTTFANIIDELVIMVQYEVGKRIIAKENTKEYNAFSILLQNNFYIKSHFKVKACEFFPKPEVNSMVIWLKSKGKTFNKEFHNFIKQCFSYKRKTLLNNLKDKYNIDLLKEHLNKNNLNLSIRAESLTINKLKTIFLSIKEN